MSIRIVAFPDGEQPRVISGARWSRLHEHLFADDVQSETAAIEFASTRLRVAETLVESSRAGVRRVLCSTYQVVWFDATGRIDKAEARRAWSLVGRQMMVGLLAKDDEERALERARAESARTAQAVSYLWAPTREHREAVLRLLLKREARACMDPWPERGLACDREAGHTDEHSSCWQKWIRV